MTEILEAAQWVSLVGLGLYCWRLKRGLNKAEDIFNDTVIPRLYDLEHEEVEEYPETRQPFGIGLNATGSDMVME